MAKESMTALLILWALTGAFFFRAGFLWQSLNPKKPQAAQRPRPPLGRLLEKKESKEAALERLIYENIENYGTKRAQREVDKWR